MKGFGAHLQLSVFQCDLTDRDLVEMTYTLRVLIDQKVDQVLIMDLGPSEGKPIKSIEYVGKPMAVLQRSATIV
jgi:CRISPR-associated protein Cas2